MHNVVRYIADCLSEFREDIDQLRRISCHIKTAYTARVALCGKEKEQDPTSIEWQARELNREAMSKPRVGGGFLSLLQKMNDHVAIDFGDCDIKLTNEALKLKFWKPRKYSEDTWGIF